MNSYYDRINGTYNSRRYKRRDDYEILPDNISHLVKLRIFSYRISFGCTNDLEIDSAILN